MPAKKTMASKTRAKKTSAKKTSAKKPSAKKATATAVTADRATAKKATGTAAPRTSGRSAGSVGRSSRRATQPRRGDLIVIDSAQVGSPAREGEILKVIVGELSVSYQVKWGDGHESLISPGPGTAHIVRP